MRNISGPSLNRLRRSGRSALLAGALAIAAPGCPPPALGQSVGALAEQRYDIAEQPLTQALAEFATVSGVNLIYPQSLARSRQSQPVNGTFNTAAALRQLLDGTGLSARFTSPTWAIIYVEGEAPPSSQAAQGATAGLTSLRLGMAEVRAAPTVGGPDRRAFTRYAQQVQSEILQRLRQDGAYEDRRFRIVIALAIDPSGRITDVTALQSSGDRAWDARIGEILVGTLLSSPPPEGLVLPMRFEVETDRLSGSTARGGGRSRP